MKKFFWTTTFSIILISSVVFSLFPNFYLFIPSTVYINLICSIIIFLVLSRSFFTGLKKVIDININLSDTIFFLLGAYLVLRYILSPDYSILTGRFQFYLILGMLYFLIRSITKIGSFTITRIIIYLIIVMGLIQAVYAWLQYFGVMKNMFDYKIGGSFGNPGDLANYLMVPYTLSLGLIFVEKRKLLSIYLLISCLLFISILAITFARAAWISTLLVTMTMFYYYKLREFKLFRNRNRSPYLIGFVILLISIGILYNFKPDSANGRLFIWKLCSQLILAKPLFGYGYESFVTNIRISQINYFQIHKDDTGSGFLAGEPMFAFNDYLHLSVEYGLLFTILLIAFIARILFFKKKSGETNNPDSLFILRVALCSILICMAFSYPIQNPSILVFVIMVVALISRGESKNLFRIKLRAERLYISYTVISFLLGIITYNSLQSLSKGVKWEKSWKILLNQETELAVDEYKSLFPYLKHDRSFLTNYGSILYLANKYDECISHFEKYGYLYANTDIYVMMGNAYEGIGDTAKAEKNYLKANYLVPHKFIPKYQLFKIYIAANQNNRALEMANQISRMKIKVYSDIVRQIKTEINEYILTQKFIKNEN